MERAHEEGMSYRCGPHPAQNKSAIKDLMEKIEQYRKGRDVYVVVWPTLGNRPHQRNYPRNHWG